MTTATVDTPSSARVLEPIDHLSEILFGLIMVLTFTGSMSVAEVGREDVREMLVGALGCNIAWGIIDALFYLMACLAEKARDLKALDAVRKTADRAVGQRLVAGALPDTVASVLTPGELEQVRDRITKLPDRGLRARLDRDDWRGALGSFLLVFLSTFPVTIPFMVMNDIGQAMRASNAVAVILLFITGYWFGKMSGRSPLGFGIGMVVFGLAIVAMTIALGG
jgi:VIT1/CCC1 family predicted Fe2+/Mn2+ transporter